MSTVIGKRIEGDQLVLLCSQQDIPIAYVQHAYDHGAEVIVTGTPSGAHDCEANGCAQSHVLKRVKK